MKISPRLQRLLPWLLSVLVLSAGAAATWSYWAQARHQEQMALDILFRSAADQAVTNIVRKLDTYEVTMRGIQGFFRGSEQVDYDEFRTYVSSLDFRDKLEGVQAVAFVAAVPRADLARHEAEIASQVPTPYRVHPRGDDELLAPITFIEPLVDANLHALGFDVFSNPVAREAAEKSRDSGQIVITQPLSLIQDGDERDSPSFVMYLPVYRLGMAVDTTAQRRAALTGWVDVPFRMNDLMAHLADEMNPWLDLEIRDIQATAADSLLFSSDDISQEQRRSQGELQQERRIQVGTRSWTVLVSNTPEFRLNATLPTRASMIGVAGGSLSLALAVLVFFITKGWDKSERRAARMSHLYHALSEVNQAIVRMETEADLFPLVCRMAVTYGGMKMAWVGILDPDGQQVHPVARFGEGVDYLDNLEISTRAGRPEGEGPTGVAMRSQEPVIVNDFLRDGRTAPWHQRARGFGWRSSAAFPIPRHGDPFAVLNVYHPRAGVFDDDAVRLFKEMCSDISFALDNFDREGQRRQFEQDLRESEYRLSTILENVGACIYLKDLEGRYLYANRQVLDLWGVDSAKDVVGSSDDAFFDEATVAMISANDRRVLEQGEILQQEEIDRGKHSGVTHTFWSVKIPLRRADGSIYGLCGISTDISEQKAREEEIRYLSNYDTLTGLPNRGLLRERARLALASARSGQRPVALLCIDLDRFKIINESLGHGTGDLVLQRIAQRLTGALHLDAVLCRIGGDEFFLLLPGADRQQAEETAARLLDIIARPLALPDRTLTITGSIGIALFPDHGRDFDQLSQSADAALAEAKQQGRNHVQLFSESLRVQVTETLQLENALRQAVELDQLVLHYQPQLDIASGDIIGVEALVRWQHPQKGMIPPGKFIPIAEESGLIFEIGNWVLEEAARQLTAWRQQGLPALTMAVNLSATQLYRSNFHDSLKALMARYQLAPGVLELEITERIAMEHSGHTITTLSQLQQLGITLSIDDFGTGFSSLNYLKRYPIQKLKIDKSFVDGLGSDSEDEAIVTAIIGLAQGLGFKTIAEGVENREQYDFLRQHGCDAYQGYYFSRPVPADDITTLLTHHRGGGADPGSPS